jgi:hypothetical protein
MAGRGAWKKSRHRRLPRFCSDAVSHIALQCADASFCYRPRRGGVGDAGGVEPACTDAPNGAPPPWGTQRRTRHRRITTVSSTSGGFHRRGRRRCLLRGRQAEAPHSAPVAPRNALRRRLRLRCTCTARARAPRHRSVLRGHELARLRVRAQLLRSARASRRAAKGAGRSMANGEMVGSSAVLAWNRPQRGGGRAHRAVAKKGRRTHGRTN